MNGRRASRLSRGGIYGESQPSVTIPPWCEYSSFQISVPSIHYSMTGIQYRTIS